MLVHVIRHISATHADIALDTTGTGCKTHNGRVQHHVFAVFKHYQLDVRCVLASCSFYRQKLLSKGKEEIF